ncbi:MAG: RHS repeat-associated core domain-containing protein, partial [bacterium]
PLVAQATDYEAWGGVLREQKWVDLDAKYRYGYQGKYAEKDDETGWNHFELREYDPVIGRWTSKDPVRQYWSPYVGMGNNPIDRIDPDGGYDNPKNWFQRFWNTVTFRGELNKPASISFDAVKMNAQFDENSNTWVDVYESTQVREMAYSIAGQVALENGIGGDLIQEGRKRALRLTNPDSPDNRILDATSAILGQVNESLGEKKMSGIQMTMLGVRFYTMAAVNGVIKDYYIAPKVLKTNPDYYDRKIERLPGPRIDYGGGGTSGDYDSLWRPIFKR